MKNRYGFTLIKLWSAAARRRSQSGAMAPHSKKAFTLIELPVRRGGRKGFTLIELLVVVTIIVVLLALLVPAMDKAIYQAELAVCGSKLKAVASATVVYAAGNNRRYPYRIGVESGEWQSSKLSVGNATNDVTGKYAANNDRPMFRSYLDINASFNCPLTGEVDYVNTRPSSQVYASYALWMGWRYAGRKGLKRIGDRFEWTDPDTGRVSSFNILASDRDVSGQNDVTQSTHPDRDGLLQNLAIQDDSWGTGEADDARNVTQIVISVWRSDGGLRRGVVDLNFAHDDGSVARHSDVEWDDAINGVDPMIAVGEYNGRTDFRLTLPRR